MSSYKPLTIDNLVRAQCIFLSIGNSSKLVEPKEYVEEKYGMHGLIQDAKNAIKVISEISKEYEIIFSLPCSNRCRMYIYPRHMAKEHLPNADYLIGITHMNHFDDSEEIVEKIFSNIEKKLLEEKYPAIKF